MSETNCKCGYPIRFLEAEKEEDGRPAMWIHTGGYGRQCPIYAEPAEPVIEVAPGEPTHTCSDCYAPIWSTGNGWRDRISFRCHAREDGGHRPAVPATCEYCGPVCHGGAEHNARVEDGSRYTDDPVPAVPESWLPDSFGSMGPSQAVKDWGERFEAVAHTAVPAQEAPRLKAALQDGRNATRELRQSESGDPWACVDCGRPQELCKCPKPGRVISSPAEPQAGAQVPSQDEKRAWQAILKWAYANEPDAMRSIQKLADEVVSARNLGTHLNTIRGYAQEAQKTPITREDMHDPLKAQTFYDEAKGFERLVLSEIGGGK